MILGICLHGISTFLLSFILSLAGILSVALRNLLDQVHFFLPVWQAILAQDIVMPQGRFLPGRYVNLIQGLVLFINIKNRLISAIWFTKCQFALRCQSR